MDYVLTQRALTVFTGPSVLTVHAEDVRFDEAVACVKDDDLDALTALLKPIESIREYISSNNRVAIVGQSVMLDGQPVDNYMGQRILEHFRDGNPVDPIVNFMVKVNDNPSKRAADELLKFIEYGNLPITPDGCFLAYKKVGKDYLDCWSKTISNHVGAVVAMPRNAVQDDPNITCSYGLHFCSLEYLSSFWGDHLMVLKIDPADVVSIPTDYNNTKGRCCKYTVVGELEQTPEESNAWGKSLVTDYEPEQEDWDDDDWDEDEDEDEDPSWDSLLDEFLEVPTEPEEEKEEDEESMIIFQYEESSADARLARLQAVLGKLLGK